MKPKIKLFKIKKDLEKTEKEIQQYLDSLPSTAHIFVKMENNVLMIYTFSPFNATFKEVKL